jgi:hypothetical protein
MNQISETVKVVGIEATRDVQKAPDGGLVTGPGGIKTYLTIEVHGQTGKVEVDSEAWNGLMIRAAKTQGNISDFIGVG